MGKAVCSLGRRPPRRPVPDSGAKTRAALQGSYIVRREDIDAIVEPVLMHRVVTNFAAESQGITPRKAVARLAAEI